jgi:hypothetical protein
MSINKITFLEQFYPIGIFNISNPESVNFYFSDWLEITKFLKGLENDTISVVSFEFILSWETYDNNSPIITLSKPILITKNSSPKIIAKFLQHRIHLTCEQFLLSEDSIDNLQGPGVLVKYSPINLF